LQVRGVPRAEQRERVTEALRMVHLGALAERFPRELSGGQQQRVGLARAIVYRPAILLLDEPLSNLDASLREEMRLEISQVTRQLGITAIYVTHDQREALALSDVIAVMNHRRIVQFGRPEAIYRSPADDFVARFVGYANAIPVRIADGIAHRGGRQCIGGAGRNAKGCCDSLHPCKCSGARAGDVKRAKPSPLYRGRRSVHGRPRRVRFAAEDGPTTEGASAGRRTGIPARGGCRRVLASGKADHCAQDLLTRR
jgi:ABC-type Fe3+/spermidine/putrescine transport system ATPase subunit